MEIYIKKKEIYLEKLNGQAVSRKSPGLGRQGPLISMAPTAVRPECGISL